MLPSEQMLREISTESLPDTALAKILDMAALQYRGRLTHELLHRFNYSIQAGPFAGMVLSADRSWGEGDLAPKILGCYEADLHPIIQEIVAKSYQTVINIGCAEGFYAVGLARLIPSSTVIAYDCDPRARDITFENAVRNGVADRITIRQECTIQALREAMKDAGNVFVLSDCEGAECELLNPGENPGLYRADLLIECHDFLREQSTSMLCERFCESHEAHIIHENGPRLTEFPELAAMSSVERALASCEFRPTQMHWLYLKQKPWCRLGKQAPGTREK
jgi:hypothetical protein